MILGPCALSVTSKSLLTKLRCLKRRPARGAVASLVLAGIFACGAENVFAQHADAQYDDVVARAAAARDEQNTTLAIDLYSEAIHIRPGSKEAWFYLGLLQYGANQFPAATEAFNHFLELEPGAAPALALRGLCEFESGAYEGSLRDLQQSLQTGAATDPRNEKIIRFHLAQLLVRAGRFDDAVTQYQVFAAHHVDNPDLEAGLGLAGMRMQVLPKDVAPDDRPLLEAVGKAGMALLADETESADAQFNDLFARYPQAHEISFFYGTLLFRHSPEMAINAFRDAATRSPSDAYTHAMLAYTLVVTGRYAEAQPEAERALAGAPELQMAQLALGVSLAQAGGDPQRSLALLNQVLQQDPNNLEAHMGLAALYSRAGRREDAYRERMVCLSLEK